MCLPQQTHAFRTHIYNGMGGKVRRPMNYTPPEASKKKTKRKQEKTLHVGSLIVSTPPAQGAAFPAPGFPTAGRGSQLVGGRRSSGLLLAGLREAPLLVDHLVQVLQGFVQALAGDRARGLRKEGWHGEALG